MSAALPTSPSSKQPSVDERPHVPVLCDEVVAALAPNPGEVIVDGTFGAGGYCLALHQAEPEAELIGIDRDTAAIAHAPLEKYAGRLKLFHSTFGNVETVLAGNKVDGLVVDLGVSSMQIDQADRGFSFRFDGPLDMRMDGTQGPTAAEVVNTTEQAEIAQILWRYGEEKRSRAIAQAIVERRASKLFETTGELAEVIRGVVKYAGGIDPATRSFQGLRIHVNDELGELERLLNASLAVLKPGGRLAVVTFHSLEDRITKRFLTEQSGNTPNASRYAPQLERAAPLFDLTPRKPIIPSAEEVARNPRARSAKLRVATRTGAAFEAGERT